MINKLFPMRNSMFFVPADNMYLDIRHISDNFHLFGLLQCFGPHDILIYQISIG